MKYSVRSDQNDTIAIEQYSISWYILSYIGNSIYLFIFRIFREFVCLSELFYEFLANSSSIYLTMSKYLREFYHSVRMTTFISFTKSTVSASFASFIFIFESPFAFLSWSSLLCTCISANDIFTNQSITQDFRFLYEQHQQSQISQKCSWFIQAKKTQESYLMRKHEMKVKSKIKQKAKKLLKQKKKIRITTKRVEEYTCKRCKHSIKFDNNIKFHEHIRIRHVKKSKSVVSLSAQISESLVSSFQSITSSSFTSSKIVVESSIIFTSFEIVSEFLSIATSKKSIFWTEIVSRSVVASKFFRFSIATLKSMCKSLKNANIVCSSISSRIFTSSRFYLIVNDLFRMFVEKSSSFDLQTCQNKSLFSRSFDKCNFKNKCDFIQNRITSYFHATISFASKSIKFETFESTHVRESFSRHFSIFHSISFISRSFRFSRIFRSFSVCRHCQKRFVIYWFIDWVKRNVSKIENNEIFMRMRYWRFASLHSVLRKYWFLLEKVIILKKSTCCLFVCFARSFSLWIVDRFEKIKSCCMLCLFVLLFDEYDRNLSLLWLRLDLTRLIIVSFFTIFEI